MKETTTDNSTKQNPPLIVELVGPAGAGKTTLSRVLVQQSEKIQIGSEIELRKPKYIPVFILNALFLLSVILRWHRHSRWFTWEEIKALVYLRGWSHVLKSEAGHKGKVVLLDHGPVFKLATLNEFGPQMLKDAGYDQWWSDMFRQWASVVDIVVWLDAPDRVLEKRINIRDQRHLVKGTTASEVAYFLARYRSSFERVLAKIESYKAPILLQFDTSRIPIEQVADEILSAIGTRIPV
jgi:thymidylate kinase